MTLNLVDEVEHGVEPLHGILTGRGRQLRGDTLHRIARAQLVGIRPLKSAAHPIPKGTVIPTYPRYKVGGCTIMRM